MSPGPPSWLRAKYRSFYGLQMAVKEGAENELKAAVTVSDARRLFGSPPPHVLASEAASCYVIDLL